KIISVIALFTEAIFVSGVGRPNGGRRGSDPVGGLQRDFLWSIPPIYGVVCSYPDSTIRSQWARLCQSGGIVYDFDRPYIVHLHPRQHVVGGTNGVHVMLLNIVYIRMALC